MTRPASPRRGGARPGAGRPATGRTVRPVQFHLPPDVLEIIDAARALVGMSRSQWIAHTIRAWADHA